MGTKDFGDPDIWKYKKANIPNQVFEDFRGESDSIGTSFTTAWGEGTIYNFPTTGSQMTVSSSSANDTAGGTGQRSVFVTYLDSNFKQYQELITLNGQTPVALNSTDVYRINSCVGYTAGSTKTNAGIIYIGNGTVTAGKPANVYSHMIIGKSFSHNGVYTVPENRAFSDLNLITSVAANKQVTIRVVTFNFFGNGSRHIFFTAKDLEKLLVADLSYNSSVLVAPGTDLRIDGKVTSGSAEFSFIYNFLLHDKGVNE